MQNFSSGFIIAPFVKSVEVEDGKKRWKGDLNSTIKQLFIDKAIGEGIEDDLKESSSSQTQEKSVGKSRALSIEEHGAESKADEIADLRKQEIHRLPIPHTGIDTQKICEIAETPLDQASQNTLSLAKVDADDVRNQEMYKILDKALVPVAQNVLGSSVVYNAAIDPSTSRASEALIQDEEIKEMYNTIQRPLVQNAEYMFIPASIQDIGEESHDSDIHLSKILFNQTITSMVADCKEEIIFSANGTRETYECRRRFSVHDAQNVLSPTVVYDTETNEAIEKSLIQTTQEAENPATIQDIATRTQEIYTTFQANQDTESLAKARNTEESHDSSIGSQEMCSTVKKPSISAAQNVPSSTKIPNAATMHPSPSQAPKLATPQSTAVIDPSPSKAPEPMTSSMLESNTYNAYKWFSDIPKQNLPYLEAGVKRHPQVLDWFNTNRQRVFATLFIEVTCILRTTRRCDLTEDDQNHIRKCCAALEAVGFDASWLNYVHGCIESCGDGNELMSKLEETEAKASTLRNELASIEASLLSLRDEASRLHDFIEP